MSTYYGTYGQKVQYLSSDPPAPQTGQVWYNSTSATLKVRAVSTVGTWSAGGNYPINITGASGAGTQTAALVFGGSTPSVTNTYNGTSWTTVPATMNTSRSALAGCGTQTAALAAGGAPLTSASESYNGTSWTNTPSLNLARYGLAGSNQGSNTATIVFGGFNGSNPAPPSVFYTNTESFNGSSWTAVNALNTGRDSFGGAGTQTAALAFAGELNQAGNDTANTESWNGTSWTTVNAMNSPGYQGTGTGTQTAALGYYRVNYPNGVYSSIESWNGTSWTNTSAMATNRLNATAAGTQTAGLAVGGNPFPAGGLTNVTELWNGPGTATTKTVTVT